MNLPTEGAAPAQGGGLPDIGRTAKSNGGPIKPITMATIAKAAGVSQGAISSLLNDRDYGIRVSEKTRERVFKVCRELGYIPNDLRAVVRMYPEFGETCLLISSKIPGGLANPFVARVAGTLIAAVPQGTLAVAVYDEARDYTSDGEGTPAPIRHGTASKFICIGAASKSLCKIAQRRSHPVVVLGHEAHIPGTTSVLPDYVGAARLAFGHLAKAGHKAVAIVGGPFGSPEPRLAELNRALGLAAAELGLQIEAQNIFQGDLSFEAGVGALDALLARNPMPTAVFALSESSACGVLARAHARNLEVPGKLSVLALVDHPGPPPTCIPVTTVAVPVDEMATTAAQEVNRQVRAGLPADAQRVMLAVQFCERESVSPRK